MASNYKEIPIGSYGHKLNVSFNETNTSTSNNTSTLTCSATLTSGGFSWSSSYNSSLAVYWHDNKDNTDRQVASISFNSMGIDTNKTVSGSITVTHKTDGKLSGYAFAHFEHGQGTSPYTPPTSDVATDWTPLTNIPRYATINNFTVSKVNETTLEFAFIADSTIDYVWYSTDNKSTWTGKDITDGTSASFYVTGLSANTTYKCFLRVRRKSSQLNTTTQNVREQTTYNYPYITGVSSANLIIGNSQKVGLYNPLKRTVTIKMYKTSTSGTQLYSGSTSSSTEFTFTPTATNLYSSIPSESGAKCVYSAIYSNSTKTTNQYTYSINASACKPVFSNFDIDDTNGTTLALTGNSKYLIKGYSTATISVKEADKATAKNYATMNKYKVKYGSLSKDFSYKSTGAATISLSKITVKSFDVYAIDSRSVSKQVTKSATKLIEYTPITLDVNSSSIIRTDNGIGEYVTLTLNGKIWSGNFGNISNSVMATSYKFKKTNESYYQNGTSTITPIVDDSGNISFSGSILTNEILGKWDRDSSYNIQIKIEDKLSSYIINLVLNSGSPGLSIGKDGVGIKCKYDPSKGGYLQVGGEVVTTGHVLWTNSSISEEFAAQTVTLSDNITDYKDYEILWCYSKYFDRMFSTGKIPTVSNTGMFLPEAYNYRRYANISNGNIEFQSCVYYATYGNTTTTTNNNYIIPYQIIGYK